MTSTARTLYTIIIDQPSLEQDSFLYLNSLIKADCSTIELKMGTRQKGFQRIYGSHVQDSELVTALSATDTENKQIFSWGQE